MRAVETDLLVSADAFRQGGPYCMEIQHLSTQCMVVGDAGAEWTSIWDEEESKCLCACLMLAAPLAAAAACLQNNFTSINAADSAHLVHADKISYPALSAAVTACQIQTAWVVDGEACGDICPSSIFGCFWTSACGVACSG